MTQLPKRLPAPNGLLIDRDKAIDFTFAGRSYSGLAGDSLASALLANGQWLLSRSFKYHRPRGPLTMAGQDANTLVQLAEEPNVLADKLPIRENLVADGQNYQGSLARDKDALLGLAAPFLPAGFYYRAFYKPLGAWDRWEPLIRQKAGLGTLKLTAQEDYYDKAYLFYQVVIIGAGAAGMAAAIKAAEGGAEVLLVDENAIVGGALSYHWFDTAGQYGHTLRESLSAKIQQYSNIRVLTEASCTGWFADNYWSIIKGKRLYKVRAQQCVVASGAFEQHVVFRNNDLPGVVLCSAAMRLMSHYGISPGQQAVVLTGNDDGYHCALALASNGVAVVAVVDMRPAADDAELANKLTTLGIKLHQQATVYQAIGGRRSQRLRAVEIRSITSPGHTTATGAVTLECDLLSMSAGYMPAYQLLCQAGAKLSYDDGSARFSLNRLPPNLRIAGSVNGIHDLDAVVRDGEAAAIQCLNALGFSSEVAEPVHCQRQTNFPWPIFKHPKGKDFVDFDEDLQTKDIINTVSLGYRDIQLVKRFSTVGMGPSQGRHSVLPAARLVAAATGRTVTETGVTTARPPYVAEKLAHLAGRVFDPYRRTPMHRHHVRLNAQWLPAGNWRRPAFYGPAEERAHCIEQEAMAVRQAVGIIDVSTLGGIEIRGGDAAEFIERLYTFRFRKQPVGKTRYAIMTNEQGVVIDDGVCCRLADDHFYVTATTSGVDTVYRTITQWQAQWRLDVDIANVTSAFAAFNVAGPKARKVMQAVCDDIDFSAAAFPYLAYREGSLDDIPIRVLRVGFVGELGYEVHLPTLFAEHVWERLLKAGEADGIRPFGVEAQRLLRLEKGHIIVGQDTDGMSHPGELSLEWALDRDKPFFVGRRSVDILLAAKQTRKLVGFRLPKAITRPQEGHLVLSADTAGADITGHVTSCEYSSTLDSTIGLAYVAVSQQALGSLFPIRVEGGEIVAAEVVALPFYDADNQRQDL